MEWVKKAMTREGVPAEEEAVSKPFAAANNLPTEDVVYVRVMDGEKSVGARQQTTFPYSSPLKRLPAWLTP
jgi:hypothetical protein